ncbi:MAG: phosphodiester glycosidase family protein [Gaiellaceae bacterium]
MLRRVLILTLLAGLQAAPAQAARTLLMPGVTYERQVQFTSHGPVALHVVNAPKPGGLWALRPVLSNGAIVGRERVTAMQRNVSAEATVAGVNGDFFAPADGRPSGALMLSSVLAAPPSADRSSIGVTADGAVRVDRIRFFGTWRGNGQRRPVLLNRAPGANGVALFTPSWGPVTPTLNGALEAVLAPFPAATPNVDLTGLVVEHRQGTGGTPIPPGGAVLVARGTGAQRVAAEAPVGTSLTARLLLSPDWAGVVDAIGGGPVLVRAGKPVFRHFELFSTGQLARNPRTAVAQRADGRVLLVVVDGRQPGYSVGLTNFEFAQTLVRLGAVAGSGLDGGGSSTMAFDGTLLNRPSDPGGERAVSEGFFVHYYGVYAAPAAEPVLSPNGDGVADAQSLAYKLVRPATVAVNLIGPDKVARELEAGAKTAVGVYRHAWNGLTAEGAPEVEGGWRFSVTAVDDLGRSSTADRLFSLNRTLGSLSVAPSVLRVSPSGGALRAGFTLARAAKVTATVETATGAVITVAGGGSFEAGPATIVWNARVGRRLVHTGRYVLRIRAVNEIGRADLTAPFSVRRVAGPPKARR